MAKFKFIVIFADGSVQWIAEDTWHEADHIAQNSAEQSDRTIVAMVRIKVNGDGIEGK